MIFLFIGALYIEIHLPWICSSNLLYASCKFLLFYRWLYPISIWHGVDRPLWISPSLCLSFFVTFIWRQLAVGHVLNAQSYSVILFPIFPYYKFFLPAFCLSGILDQEAHEVGCHTWSLIPHSFCFGWTLMISTSVPYLLSIRPPWH